MTPYPDHYHDLGTIGAQPGEEVCDFCSAPGPTWTYPVRGDFLVGEVEPVRQAVKSGAMLALGSKGGWAACDACHRLIQRADRERLARRSAKRWMRMSGDLSFRDTLDAVRKAQDSFWKERTGDPVPFTRGA